MAQTFTFNASDEVVAGLQALLDARNSPRAPQPPPDSQLTLDDLFGLLMADIANGWIGQGNALKSQAIMAVYQADPALAATIDQAVVANRPTPIKPEPPIVVTPPIP